MQNPETKTQDVLDGQQRLAAIRDFVNGVFAVDGRIEPIDPEIEKLHGVRYEELPPSWRRQFDQFTIRVFKITDFKPDEPAELFFRLNQPVALTSAEQRNAFFGPVRTQVKALVDDLSQVPIGFSNSRMALDDVVSRVCLSIESRSIAKKLTSQQLAERYRSQAAFSASTLAICKDAVRHFGDGHNLWTESVKLNKATLFSWLWASASAGTCFTTATPPILAAAISRLERARGNNDTEANAGLSYVDGTKIFGQRYLDLIQLFLDRSSSRVSDVSSVIARDVVIWLFIVDAAVKLDVVTAASEKFVCRLTSPLLKFMKCDDTSSTDFINELISSHAWGQLE